MRPAAELLDAVETLRRLSNVVRYGRVAETDPARGRARVAWASRDIGDDALSAWLPWLSAAAGEDRSWRAPSVGERVAILSPDGEIASGFVLAGFASEAFPAPESSDAKSVTAYRDGAIVSYDAEAHELSAVLPDGGTASITAPGGLAVTGDTEIDGDVTIDGNLSVTGKIDADGDIASRGSVSARDDVSDWQGDMRTMRRIYNLHTHLLPGPPPKPSPPPSQRMT